MSLFKARADRGEDRVVSGRGPVSGAGEALPDEEALAILDKRAEGGIKPVERERGVVISSFSQKGALKRYQELGFESGMKVLGPPGTVGPGGRILEKTVVFVPDLTAPVRPLVEEAAKGIGRIPHDLHLVLPRGTVDLQVDSKDLEQPDLTVGELLERPDRDS